MSAAAEPPTISRAELVKVAQRAIRQVRASQGRAFVSRSLAARVLGQARTVDRVAVDAWRIGNCGCLIGSLYETSREPLTGSSLPNDEYSVGMAVNRELRDATNWYDHSRRQRNKGFVLVNDD